MADSLKTSQLDEVVNRTEGVQPGRRIFHASSGMAIAALLGMPAVGARLVVPILGAALAFAIALDWLRLRSPEANVRFFKALRFLASPREKDQVASSTWYLIGVLCTILIAPVGYAISAVLVLALADPAASVLGRMWGRRRIGSGTLLGTAVFFAVALVILGLRHPLPLAIAAAAFVSIAEILKVPIDDNLRVPLAAAVALMGFGIWLG